MTHKVGLQSIMFKNTPSISGVATIVGPKEGAGLLAQYYDSIMDDSLNGHKSWEQCESYMMEWAIRAAVKKNNASINDIDIIFAGDLLNQLMSSHFALRSIARPFLGLYGACSTMVQGLLMGAVFVDGSFANKVVAAVSSHHDAAERQYRFPTELGVQKPPVAQWTVTGAGAAVISAKSQGPYITGGTIGKIIDMGVKDTNAMGPAMAPAAADTILQHFKDTGRNPSYYDMIFTGDIGIVGKTLLQQLLQEQNICLSNYEDCGCMIYLEDEDSHAGASGCASSAVVFGGYIYNMLLRGKYRKILLVGTGSLHSITSYQQKESIPCIAHAVCIEI